jgi:thiamine biosynthesis lipoprotein
MIYKLINVLCGAVSAILPFIGCQSGNYEIYKDTKIFMGTVVEIKVAHRSEFEARLAIDEAMREMERCDDLMSHYKPESLVSRINREGSSRKIQVDKEVFQLFQNAISISKGSNGAFDITINPVAELWGFDKGGMVPNDEIIQRQLTFVGYKGLQLDQSGLSVGFKVDGMGLDLGAIAKGWAVERAME